MEHREHDEMTGRKDIVEVIPEPPVWVREELFGFVRVVCDMRQIRFARQESHADVMMNVTENPKKKKCFTIVVHAKHVDNVGAL